ncbi:zinc ribbon domain-containing protein [uncultured Winogradskyella sp.]|uniref:zinc ribbon domain-containing protein n=1 Tax=uncultured Winogradskyella sp. TaxID=395353 RepID=UPI0035172B7A
MARHIKCPNCGEFNIDQTHCSKCGTLLSYKKRRQLAHEEREQKRKKQEIEQEKNNPSVFDKYSKSRFWIVRALITILNGIWLGFLAIGSFIAWLITAIAA